VADQRTYVTNAYDTTVGSTVTSGVTSITVASASGSPTVPFWLTLDKDVAARREVRLVTAKSGTTFTLGTATSFAHDAGASAAVVPTAELWTDVHDRVDAKPSLSSSTPAATGTAAVGVGTTAARADHVHANTFGTPGSSAVGDAANAGSGTDVARSNHVHGREGFGAVTAQTSFGASSGNGAGTTVARSDHTHGTPTHGTGQHVVGTDISAGTPGSSAVGDAAAAGAATTVARSDHTHGREAFATPTSTGTANAAGAATTLPRSDHVHAIGYAATVPSATGTAAAGAATNPARIDHVHAVGYTGEATPVALGTAAVGASTVPSRSNHVHPTTGVALLASAQTFTLAQTFSAKVVGTLGYQAGVTTLGTTGTINLDFAGADLRTQAALTGNVTFTASNYAAGLSLTIRVTNGSTLRTLTFPAGWKFVGTKPADIAASKTAVLTLTSFGTVEADVVAAWAVES
jgi:hypothetical protein